tara:strand:- start:157 stop:360 length:204 start_codon:yes stop_codon:yes gene_type:complete
MSELMNHKENLIYQLETLASYEPADIDYPSFEVAYEMENGSESFASVCCIDLAEKLLVLIKKLENKE